MTKIKRNLKVLAFFLLVNCEIFSQTSDFKLKFVKGNISEKTSALQQSSADEAVWLFNNAIDFVLDYSDVLQSDRETDALTVAAVLSIPQNYLQTLSDEEKTEFLKKIENIFKNFPKSNTIQIAVVNKINSFALYSKENFQNTSDFLSFCELLNSFVQNADKLTDQSVLKAVLTSLSEIGNENSFLVIYEKWLSDDFLYCKNEMENTLVKITQKENVKLQSVISSENPEKLLEFLLILKKNSEISQKYLSEFSENILNSHILYTENSQKEKQNVAKLQIEAIKILSENNWTKSSSASVEFFVKAKTYYNENVIDENEFSSVITSLANIALVDCVVPLSAYLTELNSLTEKGESVSEQVVLSVIKTLGIVGDKSAFDPLLSVTYLTYSEAVISAARDALAGLRW